MLAYICVCIYIYMHKVQINTETLQNKQKIQYNLPTIIFHIYYLICHVNGCKEAPRTEI